MAAAGPAQREAEAVAVSPQALMSVRGLGIRFKTSQGVWQATRKIDFDIAPGERALRMQDGRITRSANHASEKRGFGHCELAHWLAEIIFGRGFKSVVAV